MFIYNKINEINYIYFYSQYLTNLIPEKVYINVYKSKYVPTLIIIK